MNKIKQSSLICFIFSVLAFSYPVTQASAHAGDSIKIQSLQEQIRILKQRVQALETPLPPAASIKSKTGATDPPQTSQPPEAQSPGRGLQGYLTTFFGSRRIDRTHPHSP